MTGVVSIDIHHHFYPTGVDNGGNRWSIDMTMAALDDHQVAVAIASLPPVGASGHAARAQARDWNEWGTKVCVEHRGRLGLFATLPLSDIDMSLDEISYAFDVLKADGIGLPTSNVDVWLNDNRFAPVFAELNRRQAIVFVHPYPTSRCRALSHEYGGDDISPAWLEFPTNTARLILGFLVKGVARSCPDIRFIFAHAGGVMPLLLGRISGFDAWDAVGPDRLHELFPDGIHAEFARFYFDCGQAYAPESIGLMQRLVPMSHLLFGSDFSYFPMAHGIDQLAALPLSDDIKVAIGGGNAAALFRRFLPQSERVGYDFRHHQRGGRNASV